MCYYNEYIFGGNIMDTISYKKENGVVTRIDLTEEEIKELKSYGKHLCFGCKRGYPSTCPKVRDSWNKKDIFKYPFIEEAMLIYRFDKDGKKLKHDDYDGDYYDDYVDENLEHYENDGLSYSGYENLEGYVLDMFIVKKCFNHVFSKEQKDAFEINGGIKNNVRAVRRRNRVKKKSSLTF